MTLHQKGINNYNQTIKLLDEYNAQKNANEEYDKFIKDLAINRLYYSLAQILWKFCYPTDSETNPKKEHDWNLLPKNIQADKIGYRNIIKDKMYNLRKARNNSDYHAQKRVDNLELYRIDAETIFKHIRIFGE